MQSRAFPARPATFPSAFSGRFLLPVVDASCALGDRVISHAHDRATTKGTTVSNDLHIRPPDTRAVRRRVSLADRIALRIGMSLIIWSRRTHSARPSVDHATRQRLERELRERELATLVQGAAMRLWR